MTKAQQQKADIVIPFKAIDTPDWRRNWQCWTKEEVQDFVRKQAENYLQ